MIGEPRTRLGCEAAAEKLEGPYLHIRSKRSLHGDRLRSSAIDPRRCGGPVRWLEVATTAEAIARALADHGLRSRPEPKARAPPLGQMAFGFV